MPANHGTEETSRVPTGSESQNASETSEKSSKPTRNGRNTATVSQNQTLFFLAGHNGMALVEPVLLELGWKRTTDKNDPQCKIRWTECITQVGFNSFREGDHMVNHISNCGLITNKMGLLMSLREYERRSLNIRNRLPLMPMTEFFPDTFIVDDKREREAFFEAHNNGDIWINKPTGANQGKGIYLVRDILEFRQQLEERDQESRGNPRGIKARIVQRYILNPLLLNGRKFDIRCFMLIGSTSPYLVFFHPGYIRLSIHPFSNDDANLCTHLTNQFIQKKDPTYQQVKNDTIWSMEKFGDYVYETYGKEKGLNKNWVNNVLNRQMQKIMLHIFNSVKTKLANRVGFFELYGLDFMIDDAFKVWLIEVNVNPAMHTNCDLLKSILPPIIEEVLHISIECFDKSRKNKALTPLQSQKNFITIYNESLSRQSTRSGSQNSLRYWIPPRYRSSSQSPTRNVAGQSDDGKQPQTSQGLPSVSSSALGSLQTASSVSGSTSTAGSKLPRVALLSNRNFETTLRNYQKIDRKNSKMEDTTSSSNTNKPPTTTATTNSSSRPNANPNRAPFVRAPSKLASSDADKQLKTGAPSLDSVITRGTLRMSGGGGLAASQPQIKVKPRALPPQREPAPITRVQVLTGETKTKVPITNNTSRQAMVPGPPQKNGSIPPISGVIEKRSSEHVSPSHPPDRSS